MPAESDFGLQRRDLASFPRRSLSTAMWRCRCRSTRSSPTKPATLSRLQAGAWWCPLAAARRKNFPASSPACTTNRLPRRKLKRVLQVLDSLPVLDENLLALGRWIAQYYLAPIGEVYRTMLPLAGGVPAGVRLPHHRAWRRGALRFGERGLFPPLAKRSRASDERIRRARRTGRRRPGARRTSAHRRPAPPAKCCAPCSRKSGLSAKTSPACAMRAGWSSSSCCAKPARCGSESRQPAS